METLKTLAHRCEIVELAQLERDGQSVVAITLGDVQLDVAGPLAARLHAASVPIALQLRQQLIAADQAVLPVEPEAHKRYAVLGDPRPTGRHLLPVSQHPVDMTNPPPCPLRRLIDVARHRVADQVVKRIALQVGTVEERPAAALMAHTPA